MTPAFFEIEDAFAPIDESVSEFAKKSGLNLKKCPRGNSGWELVGEHPHGGQFTLLMMYDRAQGLGVASVWQYPCEEMSLLYTHFRVLQLCPIEPLEVTTRLSEELRLIRAIKFGYWTHIGPLQPPNDN